jgi:uncharacterized GH25 family protein
MKHLVLAAGLALTLAAAPGLALAHDFWAGVEKAEAGQPLVAKIGFGHNFPAGEEIKAEDMAHFMPLELRDSKGLLGLAPGPEPRLATSAAPVPAGTYLVLAATREVFFTRSPDGYKTQPKNEVPGALSCNFGSSQGKAVVNLGGAAETGLISKPVGQTLEIVPLANPARVKPGQKFPVKVLFRGQPLPGATLAATFSGFADKDDDEYFAFSGNTDQDGRVSIIPLKGGSWLAKTTFEKPYADPAVCDQEHYTATLTFTIAD